MPLTFTVDNISGGMKHDIIIMAIAIMARSEINWVCSMGQHHSDNMQGRETCCVKYGTWS